MLMLPRLTAATVAEGPYSSRFNSYQFRLGVGPASNQRWGDGGRKKGEDKQPNYQTIKSKSARSLRKIGSDAPREFSRESQLSAVSVKLSLGCQSG